MRLYSEQSNNPKWNAQKALCGRTHYVDDDTLRFHKARVIRTSVLANGLMFALVESYAVDYENTRRAFRGVIFDLFGNVIYHPELEDGFKSADKAARSMHEAFLLLNPKAITYAAIERQAKYQAEELERVRAEVDAA